MIGFGGRWDDVQADAKFVKLVEMCIILSKCEAVVNILWKCVARFFCGNIEVNHVSLSLCT